MEKLLPKSLKEDQELAPGGDLRTRGNSWIREAWVASRVGRALREREIQRVVHQLVNIYDICTLSELVCVEHDT